MMTKTLNRRQVLGAEFFTNYDIILAHVMGKKNPADGPSSRPDYMAGIEVPSGAVIPRSALRALSPDNQ